ncbi:hypothetical protein ABD91_17325 [Lysinibacillus sphaericus]|uniref:hypothetical protein n=1 Tax=Lysinibacillus sphaericus TaxID=1421 RepID=UPI0018CD9ACD|nr:hypothetical protein [Lysinibacillus sphaericus]MBG9692554.1 hypothetical protein [Lysinibacillus sphaericus]
MRKNNQISRPNIDIKSRLDETVSDGIKMMDRFQREGIVEAKLKNGTYFRADEERRDIVARNIMLSETKADLTIRILKDGILIEDVLNLDQPKNTQKMLGSFVGKSQSTISKKKNSNIQTEVQP